MLRVQLRRTLLEKWLGEPFFARTVQGCFVRLSVRGRYAVARVVEARELPTGTYPCAPFCILAYVDTASRLMLSETLLDVLAACKHVKMYYPPVRAAQGPC